MTKRTVIFCLFLLGAASGLHAQPKAAYVKERLYCEIDDDCVIREVACGYKVMNAYFDNLQLIQDRPKMTCEKPEVYVNPRCEQGKCVASFEQTLPEKPPQESLEKYLADMLYCEKNSDCRLREGLCTRRPMNIYFDNASMVAQRRDLNCPPGFTYGKPRCEENACVADLIIVKPAQGCPLASRICPDGSVVVRKGEKCEFEKCPEEE